MQQRNQDNAPRLSTGLDRLDDLLGGGLLPGTLTVAVGATGIGKTQLGLHFAEAGRASDGRPGVIFDMSCRGDSQAHGAYARRLFGRELRHADPTQLTRADGFFDPSRDHGDYLHVFDYRGRRPHRRESDFDQWQAWNAELTAKLNATIGFFYGNFIRGVRRAVIDGIDPTDDQVDSVQWDLFEYVYQQILRKDCEWVARDLFRQNYRAESDRVSKHRYETEDVACLLLCTSQEVTIDALLERLLETGDWLANANTVIYLGKRKRGDQVERALHVAKHRGSAASDEIVPFQIAEDGIRFE